MQDYKKYIKDEEILKKLELLHLKKEQLKMLLDSNNNVGPYIVELAGLPRTGKSVTTERLADFFCKGGIDVAKTKEPAQIIKDGISKDELDKMTCVKFNDLTLEIAKKELNDLNLQKKQLIIQDRGVIDNYFWYQMMYEEKAITDEQYERYLLNFASDLLNINKVYVLIADPGVIVLRDYLQSIYLEDRKKTNIERIGMLKNSLDHLIEKVPFLYKNNVRVFDTTHISEIDVAITLASDITDNMIRRLNNKKGK